MASMNLPNTKTMGAKTRARTMFSGSCLNSPLESASTSVSFKPSWNRTDNRVRRLVDFCTIARAQDRKIGRLGGKLKCLNPIETSKPVTPVTQAKYAQDEKRLESSAQIIFAPFERKLQFKNVLTRLPAKIKGIKDGCTANIGIHKAASSDAPDCPGGCC